MQAPRPHYRMVDTAQGKRMVAVAPPRWQSYARLLRLDRPIGILLLMWPTLWALWLAARGLPPWDVLGIFVAGVVLTRSAGCVFNDYADRWLDPQVERTRQRPLATGEVSAREALILFVLLMVSAFALVWFTNRPTIYLSLVALGLAVLYPYMKRVIWFPQVVLGAAFSMGIPMAYTAVVNDIQILAVLLFLANLLWTIAYDTQYAMVDREDDLKAGARSTAILFGDLDRIAIGMLQACTLLTLWLIGRRAELEWPYLASLGVAAALFAYQQWLIREREAKACFAAFLNNQWVGLAVFAGIVGALWLQ